MLIQQFRYDNYRLHQLGNNSVFTITLQAGRPRGSGGPARRRHLERGDRAGQHDGHGAGHGRRGALRAAAVPAGAGVHGGAVQEERHASPHTVLQALHARVGVRTTLHYELSRTQINELV